MSKARENIGRVLRALQKSAKGVDLAILNHFFEDVSKTPAPSNISSKTRVWWLRLVHIQNDNWGKYFGASNDKRPIDDQIGYAQRALDYFGFYASIDSETALPADLIRKLETLTAQEFRERAVRPSSGFAWFIERRGVVDLIEKEFADQACVCLYGMTGSGKTVGARQACTHIREKAKKAHRRDVTIVEASLPSVKRDIPHPRSVSRLFANIVERAHTPRRALDISTIEPYIRAAERRRDQPEHQKSWNQWYVRACEKAPTELPSFFEELPFDSLDDGGEQYLRAIAEWLASFWETGQPRDYRLVVLVDNVWNWDWVGFCLEPLCRATRLGMRVLFTSQTKPPEKLGINAIKIEPPDEKDSLEIVVRRVAEGLSARSPENERHQYHARAYETARLAVDDHRAGITQVLKRVAYLPIATVSYAAVWAKASIWSRTYKDSYWNDRLKELDQPLVNETLPTDFAEQLGSDSPDHQKNLYYALRLPWLSLENASRQRYLDLVIFQHDSVIEEVVALLWEQCTRAGETLNGFRISAELAMFEQTSLLQRGNEGLRLHDLHLSLVRNLLRQAEDGNEGDRQRDLLRASGSLSSDGTFTSPRFPVEGLGHSARVSRADNGLPLFIGEHVIDAENFLFESLPHFVHQTIGEAGDAVLQGDPGFVACRGHRAAQQFQQAVARADFERAREFRDRILDPDRRKTADLILRVSEARVGLEQTGYRDPGLPALLLPVIEQSTALKSEEMAVRAYFDLSLHYIVVGKIEDSAKTAQEAWEYVKNFPSVARRIVALRNNATPPLLRGEFVRAKNLLEQVLSLANELPADSRENRSILDEVVLHPVVSAKTTLALVEWLLGFAEQAQASAAKAIESAKDLSGHNRYNTLCHALCFAGAQMAEFLYDYRKVKEQADQALNDAHQYGLMNWDGHANLVKGWALCKSGEDVKGGKRLLADYIGRTLSGDGSPYHLAHYLFMDADVHLDEGDIRRASKQLLSALQEGRKTGEEYWLAEVRRLAAEICVRKGETKKAVTWLHGAIELSRRQGAKSFELRAATALARLWQDQGEPGQAKAVLSGIFEQFTEGFDTPDLVRVKELLATL